MACCVKRLLEPARHPEVTRPVLAGARRSDRPTQRVEEERAREEGHERDALIVELAELVQPSDGVVGLGLAMREVHDRRVSIATVTVGAHEFRHDPVVVAPQDAYRGRPVARREGDDARATAMRIAAPAGSTRSGRRRRKRAEGKGERASHLEGAAVR